MIQQFSHEDMFIKSKDEMEVYLQITSHDLWDKALLAPFTESSYYTPTYGWGRGNWKDK